MSKETTILKICNWLNVSRENFIKTFDEKTLDKIVKLWKNEEYIKVHNYGYEVKK